MNDPSVKELKDKMNYGVGRLSPVASKLYFLLNYTFLSHGRHNEVKISLVRLADDLGLEKDQTDIKSVISGAFDEIHKNTFVKYNFYFSHVQSADQIELHISPADNKEEINALIERMALSGV